MCIRDSGVIWSEVSCALILEHVGEEYVVVNGLVPSCSYDIQFINRLNHRDDYLVSDLIVRTCGNNNAIAGKFENLDFSFPSYYHRKFLSPLLTLKHSVLTTNANLSDERTKLKKTKKEFSKKLSLLRQEIDYFKGRISQNATHDEKSTLKVENLKVALQQSETAVNKLEMQLKTLTEKELELEEEYLKKKDLHLKNQLEFSKLEESLSKDLKNSEGRFQKVNQELVQLGSKPVSYTHLDVYKRQAEQCPFKAVNFQRDGPMSYYNFGPEPNYISSLPNQTLKFKNEDNDEVSDKFKGIVLDEVTEVSVRKQEQDQIRNEHIVDAKINQYYYVYGISPLDFEQPRALYEKVYNDEQKKLFVHNVVCHACKIKDPKVKKRVTQYFGLLNEDLGKVIAEGLGVPWEPVDLEGYAKTWSIASAN